MGKVISSIGYLKVLNEIDKWQTKVELKLLNSKVNRNNWQYLNLEEHKDKFAKTPILVAYVGDEIGDGHNFDIVEDDKGEQYASFLKSTAERVVGYFDNEEDIRIEEIDGVEWIVGTGRIWNFYAKELVDKLKERGLDGMSISIETWVTKARKNRATGVEVFSNYDILGTTILGDEINPAVENANIRVLQQLGCNAIRDLTLRVAEQRKGEFEAEENKEKGAERKMNLNDVETHFGEMKVLSFNEENNKVFIRENDEIKAYQLSQNENEEIASEELVINSKVVYEVDGETFEEPLSEVTSKFLIKANELEREKILVEEELRVCKENNENLQNQIDEFTELIRSKKVAEIKEAIVARAEEIKANSEIKSNLVDDLLEEAKLNEYSQEENGKEDALKEVNTRYMNEIIKESQAKQKKVEVWSVINNAKIEINEKDNIKSIEESIKK